MKKLSLIGMISGMLLLLAVMACAMRTAIGEAWRLFAYYDGEFKSDWVNQAVTGGVEIRW